MAENLTANLRLKESLALGDEYGADFLGALAGHPAVHLLGCDSGGSMGPSRIRENVQISEGQ